MPPCGPQFFFPSYVLLAGRPLMVDALVFSELHGHRDAWICEQFLNETNIPSARTS